MTPDEILERTQWDFSWVPGDTRVVDRPELAYTRCPRDEPYLNTVTRTRTEPRRLPALIEEVRRAHERVRSRWLLCPQNRSAELERLLCGAGYEASFEAATFVLPIETWTRGAPTDIVVRRVDNMERLLDCLAVSDGAFGRVWACPPEVLRADLAACSSATGRVHRFVAYDRTSGAPLASGGLTSHAELGFGFLWAGGTLPEARGRGAYLAVLAARAVHARSLGLGLIGLYAKLDSSAPIVTALGFERHGAMSYWDRPPDEPSTPGP